MSEIGAEESNSGTSTNAQGSQYERSNGKCTTASEVGDNTANRHGKCTRMCSQTDDRGNQQSATGRKKLHSGDRGIANTTAVRRLIYGYRWQLRRQRATTKAQNTADMTKERAAGVTAQDYNGGTSATWPAFGNQTSHPWTGRYYKNG